MRLVNYHDLDPGIREVVMMLNHYGFETSDSGDGVSKFADGDAEAYACNIPWPHVVCPVSSELMGEYADEIGRVLSQQGLTLRPTPKDYDEIGALECVVTATYDVGSQTAYIMVEGLDDDKLRLARASRGAVN